VLRLATSRTDETAYADARVEVECERSGTNEREQGDNGIRRSRDIPLARGGLGDADGDEREHDGLSSRGRAPLRGP
jgi:hypothetical protein